MHALHWYGGIIDLLSYTSDSSSPITIQYSLYQQSVPLMIIIIAGINVCSAGLQCDSNVIQHLLPQQILILQLRENLGLLY